MSEPGTLFPLSAPAPASLESGVTALRTDLLSPGGPRISTMRNYRFALLQYAPDKEYDARRLVRRLVDELRVAEWQVLEVSLQKLLLDRVRATGDTAVAALVERERALHAKAPERALAYVREKIASHIEGPEGIAADVIRLVDRFAEKDVADPDRALVLVGRAGALYPFFRSSALLKHLDGRTHGLSVVLLYPGTRKDVTALSFMGRLAPDRDYRPRIYP